MAGVVNIGSGRMIAVLDPTRQLQVVAGGLGRGPIQESRERVDESPRIFAGVSCLRSEV
jgi:hypothetical protein